MQYFLLINGVQSGPHAWNEIKALLEAKSITPETFYWQEGMANWEPLSTLIASAPPMTLAAPAARIYGGFWRRVFAFLIDLLVLGVAGIILGCLLFSYFCHLGLLGPVVGFVAAAVYFGFQNSELCHGQTLGKRIMGIEVVREDGTHLRLNESFLRYFPLGGVYFLAQPFTDLVKGNIAGIGIVQTLFALGWLAYIYLLIFNRPIRRLPHDWVAGSYVVRKAAEGPVQPVPFSKVHLAVFAGIVLVLFGLFGGFALLISSLLGKSLNEVLALQHTLVADPDVLNASVMAGKNFNYANGESTMTKRLTVTIDWNGRPDESSEAANKIAALVFQQATQTAATQDAIIITIRWGYNIGISSWHLSESYSHSAADWQTMIEH